MECNTIEEKDTLIVKSKKYLEERLESYEYGLAGDLNDIRDAFSDGCLFTADLAQKIVEEMFSSSNEVGKSLARDFRVCLFNHIKSKEISL